ncbi:MAG: hypothetical protein JXR77_13355 [Lentisphaeria bacterium]|nr:hypothetical protein [Lentisphaeria bacterium]
MSWSRFMRWAALTAVWAAPLCVTAEEAASKTDPAPGGTVIQTPSGSRLVIHAKSVLYDFNDRVALFEKDVTVTDSQVLLTADAMSVYLTAENSVRRIEAAGHVVIKELGTGKQATAGRAVYDVSDETVTLTEDPQLQETQQGFVTKGADRILYYRAKEQFKAEGENMQIEFLIPEGKAGKGGGLFGPTGGNDKEKKTP